MDFKILNGIISAIEGEKSNPAPSHLNLARLTVMGFEELRTLLSEPMPELESNQTETVSENTQTIIASPQEEIKEEKSVKKRRRKIGKSLI